LPWPSSEEGTVSDRTSRIETPARERAPQVWDANADPSEMTTAPSCAEGSQPEAASAPVSASELATIASQPPGSSAADATAGPDGALRSFGDYELLQELARGGMGVVFKARQRKLNRVVALKMILAGQLASPADVQRFYCEAEAAAQLDHPGIVPVYEVGEQQGQHFFSMGYVEGGSLAGRVKDGPLPPREAAALVRKIAEAVAYAHGHGIIHRDLKPANVLLDHDGQPRVTDFGLAKRLTGDSQLTGTGQVMGTPSYMPPEQAQGRIQDIGPASDVYSLGAILYCLLTGRPPFQAASVMETLRHVLEREPVAPRQLNPGVDRDLETICLKCLEKQSAKRYAGAAALAEDLRRHAAGESILARPIGSGERLWRWCRRNPRLAGAVAVISLLLLVVSIGSTWAALTIRQERNQKEAERLAAVAAREEADAARTLAQQNEVLATEQAGLALETLNTLIFQVQQRLGKDPGMQPLRRALLQTALDGLKRVANRPGVDITIRWSMEDALLRMGGLAMELGNTEEAYGYYQRRHELTKADLETDRGNARLMERAAMACINLAEVSMSVRRDMKKALALYQEALELRTRVAGIPLDELRKQNEKLKPTQRMHPYYIKLNLSESCTRVGLIHYFMGDSARAEEPILRSLALREQLVAEQLVGESAFSLSVAPTSWSTPLAIVASMPLLAELASEQRQNLARNYHLIGEIYFRLRNLEKSLVYYARCAAIREAALAEHPKDFRLRGDLGQFYEYYGTVHLCLGDTREALPLYDRSLQLLREVVAVDKSVEYRKNLAIALYSRGMAARRTKDAAGVEKCFRECLQIREELAARDPKNDRAKMDLLLVLPQCGKQEQAAILAKTLRRGRENDRELLFVIARCYAQCAAAVSGDLPSKARYEQQAVEALQAAVDQGYSDIMMLESAPDLEPVRELPGFKKLLEKVKSKAIASR
jgi:tetratricopeptide (TPR) repeat protein/tRNA A-37 threonylcarbamoyl transferase component Bud32